MAAIGSVPLTTIVPNTTISSPSICKRLLDLLSRIKNWISVHLAKLFDWLTPHGIRGASHSLYRPLYIHTYSKLDPTFLQSEEFKQLQELDPRYSGKDREMHLDRLRLLFNRGTCGGQSLVVLKYEDALHPSSPQAKKTQPELKNEILFLQALHESEVFFGYLIAFKFFMNLHGITIADLTTQGIPDQDKIARLSHLTSPNIATEAAIARTKLLCSMPELLGMSTDNLKSLVKRIQNVFKEKVEEAVGSNKPRAVYKKNIYMTPEEQHSDSARSIKDYLAKNPGSFTLSFTNYASNPRSAHRVYIKIDPNRCSIYDPYNSYWYFFDHPEKGISELIAHFERIIPTDPAQNKCSEYCLDRLDRTTPTA